MNRFFITLSMALAISSNLFAQSEYLSAEAPDSLRLYKGNVTHEVIKYAEKNKSKTPKNIIFLIGDGMGVTQIMAGLTANRGELYLNNFKHVGFSETQSGDDYVTDSAAGGTALSSGYRTYNGAIGVDMDKKARPTMLEVAENNGKATGLVATAAITHATPASFIAHQPKRNMYQEIAGDFLKTDINVFIGGGYKHFTKRDDNRNLVDELKDKGYTVLRDINEAAEVKSGKLACLTHSVHPPAMPERGNMLPVATETAINILSKEKKGFFVMIEGSQIDWGGHANNTDEIVREVLDFDKAVGKALEFAAKDGKTLVIVTADHETGGMSIVDGDISKGIVEGKYTTHGHSAVMVPIFSFGPGAEQFTGIMKNSDVGMKLIELLKDK